MGEEPTEQKENKEEDKLNPEPFLETLRAACVNMGLPCLILLRVGENGKVRLLSVTHDIDSMQMTFPKNRGVYNILDDQEEEYEEDNATNPQKEIQDRAKKPVKPIKPDYMG